MAIPRVVLGVNETMNEFIVLQLESVYSDFGLSGIL